MRALVAGMMMVALSVGQAMAAPDGVWELETKDTRFQLQSCGDGSQLCGQLVWLSDTDYNVQYQPFLNRPVAEGLQQVSQGKWKGAMTLFGQKVAGTVTQRSETQMTLTGCAFLVVCKTYQMYRVSP